MTSPHLRSADEPTPASGVGASFRKPSSGISRRTLVTGAAWSVPVVLATQAAPAQAASFCFPASTLFDSHAAGKFLSAYLTSANFNLDAIADVEGAKADITAATNPYPASKEIHQEKTFNVSLLSSLTIGGTGVLLSSLLNFAAPNVGAAAYNQYAIAEDNGHSLGASGLVSSTGAINFNGASGAGSIGSIDLKQATSSLAGGAVGIDVSAITNLKLDIGAVAGRAEVDPRTCVIGNQPTVSRSYLLAYLKAVLSSPALGSLASGITGLVNGMTIATAPILNLLPNAVKNLVSGLVTLKAKAVLDVNALRTTLGAGSALEVNLTNGSELVTLDLGRVLGNPGSSLNGLGANTHLFVDATAPTDRATALLNAWITNSLIPAIENAALIEIEISALNAVPLVTIKGTIAQFLAGTATIGGTVGGGVLGQITGTTLQSIGTLLHNTLIATLHPGGVLNGVFGVVNSQLATLFAILKGVVRITVNAQNDPLATTQPATVPAPNDLTPPTPWGSIPAGRYDVAALHVGLLNGGGLELANLFLARGSAGRNLPRP